MLRLAAVAALLLAGCSKSATNQEGGTRQPATDGEKGTMAKPLGTVAVPGGEPIAGAPMTEGAQAKAGDDLFRLKPDEGTLTIEVPDAKAGAEVTAKVIVTPGAKYKVNVEFPTKLTLESTTGVTFAKAEMKAGGASKAKGDADQFDEKQLTFAVKLTPSQTGSYTINGSFKFAVCDKDQCLAKKEPIAIQVAAK
ncbi:MAG: hypothetical protein WKG01_31305 [Kofleriaceae bacterium]